MVIALTKVLFFLPLVLLNTDLSDETKILFTEKKEVPKKEGEEEEEDGGHVMTEFIFESEELTETL